MSIIQMKVKKVPEMKLVEIEGVYVVNTTGLRIFAQWYPTINYVRRVLWCWEKALEDVYKMCGTPMPDDFQVGAIYDENILSHRIGNVFLISPWIVTKEGSHGTRSFKRRYIRFIKTPKEPSLRDRLHKMALHEISKTEANDLEKAW